MKLHDQKEVGEGRVYLAYKSTSLFVIEGNRTGAQATWNLGAGAVAEATEGTACWLAPWLAQLSLEPWTTFPGMAPPTMGGASPSVTH